MELVSKPNQRNEETMTKRPRPYRNVVPARTQRNGWEARLPSNGKHTYLGTFDSPEKARRAVLIAQAEKLEDRAAAYRAEADNLGPSAGRSGPQWAAVNTDPNRSPQPAALDAEEGN